MRFLKCFRRVCGSGERCQRTSGQLKVRQGPTGPLLTSKLEIVPAKSASILRNSFWETTITGEWRALRKTQT